MAKLTPEAAVWAANVGGGITTDETPGQLMQILNEMPAFRHLINSATIGASENAVRLATGDWDTGKGYIPPAEGGLGTLAAKVAGGLVPGFLTGLAGNAAVAGLSRISPAIASVPRIAQTAMGAVENAGLGAAQGMVQNGPDGALQGAEDAVASPVGAAVSWAIPGSLRAIGYMYAKGIRLPPIGPKLPAESYPNKVSAWLNRAIPQGTIDPTLAKPFDRPDIGLWEGMNTGLQRVAGRWGIDLPLIAARPNDKVATWMTHKMGQVTSMQPYLDALDGKNDIALKQGFQRVIDDIGASPQMRRVATGSVLKERWDGLVHGDLLGQGSKLYEDILKTGVKKGTLGDFRIDGSELADQLDALLESKGYVGISTTAAPEANMVRNVIKSLRPKEQEETFLSILGSRGEQIAADAPPPPKPSLNEIWTRAKELPWPKAHDNASQTIKEAKGIINAFVRDRAEAINPNAGGLFEVADALWKRGKMLQESELGKIMTAHPEKVVPSLTKDVTTMRQVKEMLNDSDPTKPQVGDQFIEMLAKRKLASLIEDSLDPSNHNRLDFSAFHRKLTSWGGPVSARNEYMQELFGSNPEVLKNLDELHSLMQATARPRKLQSPQQLSGVTAGGIEAQAAENTLNSVDTILTLLLRFAYGKALGKFITNAPAEVNPLLGGLRPAMGTSGPGNRPIQLMNVLRQAGGSAQRNPP